MSGFFRLSSQLHQSEKLTLKEVAISNSSRDIVECCQTAFRADGDVGYLASGNALYIHFGDGQNQGPFAAIAPLQSQGIGLEELAAPDVPGGC